MNRINGYGIVGRDQRRDYDEDEEDGEDDDYDNEDDKTYFSANQMDELEELSSIS